MYFLIRNEGGESNPSVIAYNASTRQCERFTKSELMRNGKRVGLTWHIAKKIGTEGIGVVAYMDPDTENLGIAMLDNTIQWVTEASIAGKERFIKRHKAKMFAGHRGKCLGPIPWRQADDIREAPSGHPDEHITERTDLRNETVELVETPNEAATLSDEPTVIEQELVEAASEQYKIIEATNEHVNTPEQTDEQITPAISEPEITVGISGESVEDTQEQQCATEEPAKVDDGLAGKGKRTLLEQTPEDIVVPSTHDKFMAEAQKNLSDTSIDCTISVGELVEINISMASNKDLITVHNNLFKALKRKSFGIVDSDSWGAKAVRLEAFHGGSRLDSNCVWALVKSDSKLSHSKIQILAAYGTMPFNTHSVVKLQRLYLDARGTGEYLEVRALSANGGLYEENAVPSSIEIALQSPAEEIEGNETSAYKEAQAEIAELVDKLKADSTGGGLIGE